MAALCNIIYMQIHVKHFFMHDCVEVSLSISLNP